ncbi:serine hydrolase domain-containing protein [Tamlana sp. I1]|uniref:serine hydrolase domain-containing protein n=1 Tax=Tamlana sp. I1 TaxID=2762061 RepID=UPI001890ABE1|nr:serine hydrolase domain-containing protein [Tamlana sp. I1]
MKKINYLILLLFVITSCKSNVDKSKTTSSSTTEVAELQISDSIKAALDSIVFKVAHTNGCRTTAAIKGPNTASYYSGFDGRTHKKITNFDDLYEIGSITKMFTATSILQLIEKNKLSLDTPLTSILPNASLQKDLIVIDGKNYIDSIKVINLLNHTAGLPDYFLDDELKELEIHSDPALVFTNEDLIALAKANPDQKLFIPGTSFRYCNLNYILLAMIIEKLSKQTYQEYAKEHIIEPLKLEHTFYGSLYPTDKRPKGHYKDKEVLLPFTYAGAAGEILSTLDDTQTFIAAWNKGLLFKDPKTLKSIKTEYFNDMVPGVVKYGAGVINLLDLSYGHGGETFGYQSYLGTMISNDYTFAISIDDATVSGWYPAIETSQLLKTIE